MRNEILALSPTLNLPSSNVFRSSATSSGARGWRPLTSSSDWFTDSLRRVPRQAEGGRLVQDRLAVRAGDERVPEQVALGEIDTVDAAHDVDERLGHRRPGLLAAALLVRRLERLLRAHDGVDALGGVREQVVEDVAERVGEHERARHERDAEHDGERRQDETELLGQRGRGT